MDILFHTMDGGFDEVDDIRKIIENQQFFHLQVLRSLRKEIYNCWHGWEMRFDAFLNIQIMSVINTPLKIGHKRQEKVSPISLPYA